MSEVASDVVPAVIEHAAALLAKIRARAPRVHCITNTVAQAFTANMLLAAGATPSVTTSPEEIAGFVAGADSLLVNLGTLDAERRAGDRNRARCCARASTCRGCSIRCSSTARPRGWSSRVRWWRAGRRSSG